MSSSTLVHLAQARPLKPGSRHGSLRWKPSSPRSKCVPRTALAGSLILKTTQPLEGQASTVDVSTSQRPITMTQRTRANADSALVRVQQAKDGTESTARSARASATATRISTAIDANRFSAARHRAIIQTPPVFGRPHSTVIRRVASKNMNVTGCHRTKAPVGAVKVTGEQSSS